MRYWDASAVVPLLVEEPGTRFVRAWASEDAAIATWALTRLEVASAIERRSREGRLTASQRRLALRSLDGLASRWDEVADLLPVRARALEVLARHPLRAADAAQLGAALVLASPMPTQLSMVCLDRGLAAAARGEGLEVLSWPDAEAR